MRDYEVHLASFDGTKARVVTFTNVTDIKVEGACIRFYTQSGEIESLAGIILLRNGDFVRAKLVK